MNTHAGRLFICIMLLGSMAAIASAATEKQNPNAFQQERKIDMQLDGKITAIDPAAGTVTVKHSQKGPMTFSVTKGAMLFVNHKQTGASLADFKVGEEVRLLYRQDGTNLVAHSMWQPGANPKDKEHRMEKQSQPR